MLEFFKARVVEQKRIETARIPYRNKYFTTDCYYDSHAKTIQRMESEKISEIDDSEPFPKVITEQNFPFRGKSMVLRLQYILKPHEGSWLISEVLHPCFLCQGKGDVNCPQCKGKRWYSSKE